jgi:hypothetical protein
MPIIQLSHTIHYEKVIQECSDNQNDDSSTQTKNKVQTPYNRSNAQVIKTGMDTDIRGTAMEGWSGKVLETT